jgi:hypothetical protein
MSEQSFEVGAGPALDIILHSGRVDLHEGDPGWIRVEVTGAGAEGVETFARGDHVIVRDLPGRGHRRRSVTVRIVAPPGMHLTLRGASLDLYAKGELGDVSLVSASGDVELDVAASVVARAASGDIALHHCRGRLRVNTASGDMTVLTVDEDATVVTASGDIRIGRIGGDVHVKTASGDVLLDECRGGSVLVRSLSGDVAIGLPAGRRVEADLNTLSGSVHLPERGPSTSPPTKTVRLQIQSVSGDIRVFRA